MAGVKGITIDDVLDDSVRRAGEAVPAQVLEPHRTDRPRSNVRAYPAGTAHPKLTTDRELDGAAAKERSDEPDEISVVPTERVRVPGLRWWPWSPNTRTRSTCASPV